MGIEKLLHIDRRIIFLLMALAVGLPLALGLTIDPGGSPRTQDLYDYIDELEPGSAVLVAFDYGPASMPELNPMAAAVARHALENDIRVLAITLIPEGAVLADDILNEVGADLGRESGVHYVNLGYKPGFVAVVLGMATDIGEVFETDFRDRPYNELPVAEGLRNFDDIALVVDLASSDTPRMWILYAHERYGATIAAGVTAVMATDFYPYLQSGQLIGLLNGMKGAAEYEKLVGAPGDGMRGMVAQSTAQFLIIGLVILGNIAYLVSRRHRR